MLSSLVFAFAILVIAMKCGYSLGELSLSAIVLMTFTWLTLLGITVAMGWPPAVMIVASVGLAIFNILAVFGGDLRIR